LRTPAPTRANPSALFTSMPCSCSCAWRTRSPAQ
jgi:hypothetical protein